MYYEKKKNSLLKLENVSKKIRDSYILKSVSIDVERGDIFGFIGPNGAGKTSTIRVIGNIYSVTSGRIEISGSTDLDMVIKSGKVSFTLDSPMLYPKLTVYENINYYASFFPISNIKESIDLWLKRFDIEKYRNTKVSELSKGNRQKVALARMLVSDAELYILDEPYVSLDIDSQFLLSEVIKEENSRGKTFFISSHNMPLLERLCSKVAFIEGGSVIFQSNINDIEQDISLKNSSAIKDGEYSLLERLYLTLKETGK